MDLEEWLSHAVPVVEARYVRDYTVWLRFEDGVEGEADLTDVVFEPGEWVAPLRDVEYFKKFKVKFSSIEWPNGADFAPEFGSLSPSRLLRPEILQPGNSSARAAARFPVRPSSIN